jgi:hypothetical protein
MPGTIHARFAVLIGYPSWLRGEHELLCTEEDGMVSSGRSTIEPLFRQYFPGRT